MDKSGCREFRENRDLQEERGRGLRLRAGHGRSGQTILSAVVGAGVAMLGLAGVATMITYSQKAGRSVQQRAEVSGLMDLLRMTLGSATNCQATLSLVTGASLSVETPNIDLTRVVVAATNPAGIIVPGASVLDISNSARFGAVSISSLRVRVDPEVLRSYLTLPTGNIVGSLHVEAQKWDASTQNAPTSLGARSISGDIPLFLSLGQVQSGSVPVTGCTASSDAGATGITASACRDLGGSYSPPNSTTNEAGHCDIASSMCRQFGGTWSPSGEPPCALQRASQTLTPFYLNSYANGRWYQVSPPGALIAPVISMCGENSHGMILAGGASRTTVIYLNSYSSPVWTTLAAAPFSIDGMAGDNMHGPVIFSGKRVAYMNAYSANIWHQLPDAPWNIGGISGDNRSGPVVFGSGTNNKKVAYLNRYSSPSWTNLPDAPFEITAIAGDNAYGPVVLGVDATGVRVAHLDHYSSPAWIMLPSVPDPNIRMIAGNNSTGVIVSDGQQSWYNNNYSANLWTRVSTPPVASTRFLAGENGGGPIVIGLQ